MHNLGQNNNHQNTIHLSSSCSLLTCKINWEPHLHNASLNSCGCRGRHLFTCVSVCTGVLISTSRNGNGSIEMLHPLPFLSRKVQGHGIALRSGEGVIIQPTLWLSGWYGKNAGREDQQLLNGLTTSQFLKASQALEPQDLLSLSCSSSGLLRE